MRNRLFQCHTLVISILVFILFVYGSSCRRKPEDQRNQPAASSYSIAKGDVSVDAKLDANQEGGDEEGPFDFVITVQRGKDKFEIGTMIVGVANKVEAVEEIRNSVRWKDNYLFVPSSCGGGNAWKCNTDHIFKVINGRLVHVGETVIGAYKNGLFYDVYDKLEINELTSHAEAPVIMVVLREDNGHLVPNIEKTWEQNRKEYYVNEQEISGKVKTGGNSDNTDNLNIKKGLLFNAALSKYCSKDNELKTITDTAGHLLDSSELKIFNEVMTKIKSAQIP